MHNRFPTVKSSHLHSPASPVEPLEPRTLLSSTPTIVGYLPDYRVATLHSPASQTLDRINWSALTQINYFSVKPDGVTGALPGTAPAPGAQPLPAVSTNPDSSINDLAHLSQVVSEAHAHHVKVSIVIGGAGYDSTLTTIAADADLRVKFAASVQAFATKYGVDGVDLDWELQHPWQYQIDNYGLLIQTLRNHTTGLKITAAVYPEQLSIATDDDPSGYAYNTFAWQLSPTAIANLDQINIMDYDLDYADHSPITRSENDMDAWATYLSENGAPASKLLFGIPFYGKAGFGWGENQSDSCAYNSLIDAYNADNGQPASQSLNQVTAQLSTILLDDFTQVWHFNSVNEVQQKTQFTFDRGFGGVMAWDIGMDHLDGTNVNDDPYSLLAAINRTVAANYHPAYGFADLVAVAQHYGTTGGATLATGDYNADGNVDFADLVLIAQHYQSTPATAPLPPTTIRPLQASAFSTKPIARSTYRP